MGFRGQGFMLRKIDVTADMASKQTTLSLAENDGRTLVYINGKQVSDDIVKGVRKLTLPAGTWKEGSNQLLIKLGNIQAASWFGPGLSGKPDDLYLSHGAEKISLTDDWKLMPSFVEKHEFAHLGNNVGTTIYNAMISPVVPFGIKGVLWYQGETNAGRAFQYRQSFPLMINNWRNIWSLDDKPDNFSFYWVQLSSYGANQDSNRGSSWAELREAQNMALSLPKTGMAVTTDIGNPKDIHPTNKQDVAHRLATNALKFDYGKEIPYSSPLYRGVSFEGNKAIVSLDHSEGGLVARVRIFERI
jgi:sialate O-acetylesterase